MTRRTRKRKTTFHLHLPREKSGDRSGAEISHLALAHYLHPVGSGRHRHYRLKAIL
jgi:hypothetical protein